jgi:membrane protein required for colicin V production
MNLAVYLCLPVIVIFGFIGYRDGVVKRIIEIAGAFVALLLTARFATGTAPWVMEQTGLGEGPALLITWAGMFFAGLILARLLANLLSKAVRLTILGGLDRLGGALVGVAMGTLVSSVILVAASQVPGGQAIQASYDETPAGRFVFYSAPNVYRFFRGLAGGKADAIWQRALETTEEKAGQAGQKVHDAVKDTADEVKEGVEKEVKEKLDDASG